MRTQLSNRTGGLSAKKTRRAVSRMERTYSAEPRSFLGSRSGSRTLNHPSAVNPISTGTLAAVMVSTSIAAKREPV